MFLGTSGSRTLSGGSVMNCSNKKPATQPAFQFAVAALGFNQV